MQNLFGKIHFKALAVNNRNVFEWCYLIWKFGAKNKVSGTIWSIMGGWLYIHWMGIGLVAKNQLQIGIANFSSFRGIYCIFQIPIIKKITIDSNWTSWSVINCNYMLHTLRHCYHPSRYSIYINNHQMHIFQTITTITAWSLGSH